MKGLHKLGSSDVPEELLSISVKHDLTVEERKKEKQLRLTVKENNDKNQEKNLKFVIMGPPWGRYMGTLQKKGSRWVPLRTSPATEATEILPMPPLEEVEGRSTEESIETEPPSRIM